MSHTCPQGKPSEGFKHRGAGCGVAVDAGHGRSSLSCLAPADAAHLPDLFTPRTDFMRFLRSFSCFRDFCAASARPFCKK